MGDTLATVFSQFIRPRQQPRAAHRITPRNLFDIALGSDNLWKKDTYSLGGKITVVNLMKKDALCNFLSSFSGTHLVSPRTVQAQLTFHF